MILKQRKFFFVKIGNIERKIWLTAYSWGIQSYVEQFSGSEITTFSHKFPKRKGGIEDCERRAMRRYGVPYVPSKVYTFTSVAKGIDGKLRNETCIYTNAQSAWCHFRSRCKCSQVDMDNFRKDLLVSGRDISYEYTDSENEYFLIGVSVNDIINCG